MTYEIYQPKWQYNDYYQYNFRVNKGDSIKLFYALAAAAPDTATASITISAGATALGASAVALSALLYTF